MYIISGVLNTQERLKKRVVEMGGVYSGDFTKKVNVLLAHSILGSEKYLVNAQSHFLESY